MDHNVADRQVQTLSACLDGCQIDLVVTGSIAAVESFALVRALRRLSATVRVVLSPGAELFVTRQALEWASDHAVTTSFAGRSSHLARGDICVVAPCSASFLAKVATGAGDHPAATLVQSYLGTPDRRVLMLPCMHDSLFDAPMNQVHHQALIAAGVTLLAPRQEAGKQKFPQAGVLARDVAHYYHQHRLRHAAAGAAPDPRVVLSMGSTRGYIDPVRYITARSSGELATELVHELYSYGFAVHVICGDAVVLPEVFASLTMAPEYEQMQAELVRQLATAPSHVVLAAAVSDYLPQESQAAKILSGQASLAVTLRPTPKMRAALHVDEMHAKICFKQSIGQEPSQVQAAIATTMHEQDGVSMVVFNALEQMDRQQGRYEAWVRHAADEASIKVHSKRQLATHITTALLTRYHGVSDSIVSPHP